MAPIWAQIQEQEEYKAQLERDIAAKAMEVSEAQDKLKALETDLRELEGGSSELLKNLKADLKQKISELSALTTTSENLLAEKEKMEGEVAELEAQKRELEATLASDADVNAAQIATIKELTDTAAADTEELDALEAQCLELSAELKDKEAALRQVQELERKCSREYIAYEKAKQKGAKAKTAERKDLRKFG